MTLTQGELASITEEALLAGGNLAAVENADGDWELIQFQTAELVEAGTYDLPSCSAASSALRRRCAIRSPPAPGSFCSTRR